MVRRPPDFGGQAVAARAQRLDRRGKQQRLADGDDLRLEALLRRLRPERGEVRRDHHAGDDLDARRLEGRDLRGEVVVHLLIAAGIDQLVAGRGERRRQAALLVAPGVAVGVVREQAADHLVARRAVPQRGERRDHVLQPPEEQIGPVEALGRIALAAEEVRLPRAVGGDARHLVDLGLVGHRIGGVGRARRDHQVDLVGEDQFGRDLRGAAAARLAVLGDDLNLMGPAAALQALAQEPRAPGRRMNSSASPKPASGPVLGLTWPILMTLACALAELALSSAGAAMAAAPDLMSVRRLMRFTLCHGRLPERSGVSRLFEMLQHLAPQRRLLLGAPLAKALAALEAELTFGDEPLQIG